MFILEQQKRKILKNFLFHLKQSSLFQSKVKDIEEKCQKIKEVMRDMKTMQGLSAQEHMCSCIDF